MAEAGVDISGHCSKLVDDLTNRHFDLIITVCGHAHEACPVFPEKGVVVHAGFDDPPKLAESASTEAEKLDCYRRVRDEIRRFVETLPERLDGEGEDSGEELCERSLTRRAVRERVRKCHAGG